MRRSIFAFLAAASAVVATSPAVAAPKGGTTIMTLPPSANNCDITLTAPDAIDCAGYYPQNQNAGDDIAGIQEAIASLDGDVTWDGDWAAAEDTKVLTLTGPNSNQINFGETLFGLTVIGAHFGNIDDNNDVSGNVTVFWLFDFGTEGANFITLENTRGFSNAVLYTTGNPPAVPEPATWAMMLMGFGAAGTAMRRSRRGKGQIAQLA
jgi:hypothetical protein